MSDLLIPKDVFFFVSALFTDDIGDDSVSELLSNKFGPSYIFKSNFFPMKEYYSKEMGNKDSLSRLVFLFPKLESRELLVDYKCWADAKERELSFNNKRKINLDIGYMSLENVVLATGKQFSHRIYLGRGVFADLNLIYEKDSYSKLGWTYPDYSSEDFISFFNWSRTLLLKNLK